MSNAHASAMYTGWIRHRRHAPHPHDFRYRLFQIYLDLDEVERVFAQRWFWSVGRRNLAEFRRSDYHGDPSIPLKQAVLDRVEAETGVRPAGPVRLLTHLRYFGYCFNPVSFYYCFAADGTTLEVIVAEITNTPWGERHAYVLPVATADRHGPALEWGFEKRFHVSPFLPMARRYRWRFTAPDDALRVHMDVLDGDRSDFDATLVLERRPINGPTLARCLLGYPLMTLKVLVAIHWQALLIWLRRNPVYDHPTLGVASKTRTSATPTRIDPPSGTPLDPR